MYSDAEISDHLDIAEISDHLDIAEISASKYIKSPHFCN
jgi:hypothetical protein